MLTDDILKCTYWTFSFPECFASAEFRMLLCHKNVSICIMMNWCSLS